MLGIDPQREWRRPLVPGLGVNLPGLGLDLSAFVGVLDSDHVVVVLEHGAEDVDVVDPGFELVENEAAVFVEVGFLLAAVENDLDVLLT